MAVSRSTCRRIAGQIMVAVFLGAATTIAVAWTLALWPREARFVGSAFAIDPMSSDARRGLYMEDEFRPGLRSIQMSVSEESPDGSIGPAWHPFPGTITGREMWRLRACDTASARAAMANFPNPIGTPPQPDWDGHRPDWPRWLPPIPDKPDGLISYGARAAGWPLPCLRSTARVDRINGPLNWSWSWPLLPAGAYSGLRIRDPAMGSVPLLPEPVGFAANTAITTGIWAVILFVPGALRRKSRRRRGRCPSCGYDLAATAMDAPCPECGSARPPPLL